MKWESAISEGRPVWVSDSYHVECETYRDLPEGTVFLAIWESMGNNSSRLIAQAEGFRFTEIVVFEEVPV